MRFLAFILKSPGNISGFFKNLFFHGIFRFIFYNFVFVYKIKSLNVKILTYH